MVRAIGLFVASLSAVWVVHNANAQECTPEAFLTRDSYSLDENTETKLILLRTLMNNQTDSDNTDLKFTYGSYDFAGKRAQSAANRMESLLSVDYSQVESRNILTSILPQTAVDAYRDCLKNQNDPISVSFNGDVMYRKEFFIKVWWHPKDTPTGIVSKIYVDTLTGSTATPIEAEVSLNKSKTFKIVRDIGTESEVNFTLSQGGEYALVLPPAPSVRIEHRLGYSEPQIYESTDTIVKWEPQFCVSVPPELQGNAVLLPGTFKFEFIEDQRLNRRVDYASDDPNDPSDYVNLERIVDDQYRACNGFWLSTDATRNYAKMKVRASALMAVSVDASK